MNISKTKEQIKHRKQSVGYAFAGFKVLWKSEINFRTHVIISLLVFCLGFIFKLNNLEWIGIVFCVGMVISAEAFNSAIEHLCDLTSNEIMPEIKIIKDISAFAVLFLAIISSVVGIIIFLPKIIHTFNTQ
jgi:diacylglycerol kinase